VEILPTSKSIVRGERARGACVRSGLRRWPRVAFPQRGWPLARPRCPEVKCEGFSRAGPFGRAEMSDMSPEFRGDPANIQVNRPNRTEFTALREIATWQAASSRVRSRWSTPARSRCPEVRCGGFSRPDPFGPREMSDMSPEFKDLARPSHSVSVSASQSGSGTGESRSRPGVRRSRTS
jgi:hypothetical protein